MKRNREIADSVSDDMDVDASDASRLVEEMRKQVELYQKCAVDVEYGASSRDIKSAIDARSTTFVEFSKALGVIAGTDGGGLAAVREVTKLLVDFDKEAKDVHDEQALKMMPLFKRTVELRNHVDLDMHAVVNRAEDVIKMVTETHMQLGHLWYLHDKYLQSAVQMMQAELRRIDSDKVLEALLSGTASDSSTPVDPPPQAAQKLSDLIQQVDMVTVKMAYMRVSGLMDVWQPEQGAQGTPPVRIVQKVKQIGNDVTAYFEQLRTRLGERGWGLGEDVGPDDEGLLPPLPEIVPKLKKVWAEKMTVGNSDMVKRPSSGSMSHPLEVEQAQMVINMALSSAEAALDECRFFMTCMHSLTMVAVIAAMVALTYLEQTSMMRNLLPESHCDESQ